MQFVFTQFGKRQVLDWPFFELKQNSLHNIWRIRSFLQTMTSVGTSMLEGSHCITIAAKLLTGMNLDESLPFMAHKQKGGMKLPTTSPIWGSASVQVLTDKTRAYASKEKRHHVMLEETLRYCRKFSKGVAKMETHYIDLTWRDWIGQVLLEIDSPPTSINSSMQNHSLKCLMKTPRVQMTRTFQTMWA
jgi:hypothetical protein